MRVLTVNAGSSSLKLRLLAGDDRQPTGFSVDKEYDDLGEALAGNDDVDAVGHRFVHGGHLVTGAALLDETVLGHLRDLVPLAPLHQPTALDAVEQVTARWPDVPQVACPDTAFHSDLPAAAVLPAVPREWVDAHRLRRYGFHGLSVASASRRVGELYPEAHLLVVAHLGSGASLTAVRNGRSVDTTMGFTPLDGLVMSTRSGGLDPGMVLWLVAQGMTPQDLVHDLETRSGLTAIAGTGDMREILTRRDAGDVAADLAYAVYVHRLRSLMASMVAALEGIDVLVLTGGVAEGSATVRASATGALSWLGVELDHDLNADAAGIQDVADLTAPSSASRVLLVAAREDVEIARQTVKILTGDPAGRTTT